MLFKQRFKNMFIIMYYKEPEKTKEYEIEIEKNKFKLNFDYDDIYMSITLKNVNGNEQQYFIWKGELVNILEKLSLQKEIYDILIKFMTTWKK